MTDDPAATLRAIVERLDRLGIPYMLVGSIAALAHGRSRTLPPPRMSCFADDLCPPQ